MTNESPENRAALVQAMFTRIARRYDLMNRLMTAGQDKHWRRRMLDQADLIPGGRVLDLGAGTGDLAAEAARRDPLARLIAGDYTLEMMRQGRTRRGRERFAWVNLDALTLPFPSDSFDTVVSGYLLRNVGDVQKAWEEQVRVLKPGGVVVCLDTTPPSAAWWHAPVRFYLRFILPALGRLVTGDPSAYSYLPESTRCFLTAEQLADAMRRAGFKDVGFYRLGFGTMAVHWGYK